MGIEHIRLLKAAAGIPKPKKEYVIPKKSKKKIAMEILAAGDDKALDLWFEQRRKDLTGRCAHCGGKTWTAEDDLRIQRTASENEYESKDETWRHCIAHILPKAYFKSIATHPLNFVELCFWTNNCHGNYDNKILDLIDLNCFDTVIERFVAMYPFIAKEERKRIPPTLMNYIETDEV